MSLTAQEAYNETMKTLIPKVEKEFSRIQTLIKQAVNNGEFLIMISSGYSQNSIFFECIDFIKPKLLELNYKVEFYEGIFNFSYGYRISWYKKDIIDKSSDLWY